MYDFDIILKNYCDKYEKGLEESEITEIERVYGVTFPKTLKDFLRIGVPISENDWGFPNWRDLSNKNIEIISKRINAPYEWLKIDVLKHGFWQKSWGECPKILKETESKYMQIIKNAPILLPVYSHRYMPVIEGEDDLPIISSVGRDTVCFANNLSDYIKKEFCNECTHQYYDIQNIPFWSDIIRGAIM